MPRGRDGEERQKGRGEAEVGYCTDVCGALGWKRRRAHRAVLADARVRQRGGGTPSQEGQARAHCSSGACVREGGATGAMGFSGGRKTFLLGRGGV